jgi:two-component system, NarL family, nitrate/nitrite response regulator NarL
MMPSAKPIKVFLVSGHSILLWGLQQLVSANDSRMSLAGYSSSTATLMDSVASASPDVILFDLDMPAEHATGIATLAAGCTAKILVMTRHDDQTLVDKAVLDGACGVLKSNSTPANFIEAIQKVHAGQIWLDRAATGRIMVELSRRQNGQLEQKKPSRLATLTDREKSIVASVLENSGDPAKTLAKKLHISESTLRNHLTSIYSKLDISNRFELISFAHKNELQQPSFSATA